MAAEPAQADAGRDDCAGRRASLPDDAGDAGDERRAGGDDGGDGGVNSFRHDFVVPPPSEREVYFS